MNVRTVTQQEDGAIEVGLTGAVAGVVATVAMGGVQMATGQQGGIAMAFPATYGVRGPAPAIGWVIHLFHGAVLGGLYATVAAHPSVAARASSLGRRLILGVGYGLALTVVAVGLVMPVWLGLVGFPGAPPLFGAVGTMSVLTHVAYGAVLGLLVPTIRARIGPLAGA
ncbi:MAG: histidine kinase [Salinirussus sp.]